MNYKWSGVHYGISLNKELHTHIKSRGDAKDEAEKIRLSIRAGTFRKVTTPDVSPDALMFQKFGELWIERGTDRYGRVGRSSHDGSIVKQLGLVELVAGPLKDVDGGLHWRHRVAICSEWGW